MKREVTSNEESALLTELGLTENQATVYLTLAKLGKATTTTIASISKVDRANLYRVISRLTELGLVEKIITNPCSYRALPLHEAIAMLIECKDKDCIEIKTKAKQLLDTYRKNDLQTDSHDACQFALIPSN